MTTRRRFIGAAGAWGAGVLLAQRARAQSRPTINVKKIGAFGTGKSSDLYQIRQAIRLAAEHPAGATVYFPPGEYYLGASDAAELLSLRNLKNLRFAGERATLSCRTISGRPEIFLLGSSRNIVIEGFSFKDYGSIRSKVVGTYAISVVKNAGPPTENVEVRDCTFDGVVSAFSTHGEGGIVRAHGITLTNLSVERSTYGYTFADCGDDVTGRGLRCSDVMRSYFPYGVSNHDIELDTRNNATGYTDVLIKCYNKETSRLRVKVKCRGKRGGDAIVAFDNQHSQGRGVIRDVNVDLDVDDADCGLDRVFLMRSFDGAAKYERQTQNRWDNLMIDGDVRICDTTKLVDVLTISKTPGRLVIGSRLAQHPRLPSNIPGFTVTKA